jgi:hypothetical protein
MSQNDSGTWLLLLFNLPAKCSSCRVKVWRRLKKFGAIQLKTSTYVVPDEAVHYERLQWLAKEIVDNGGEVALVRVKDIEGTPYPALVAMFNEASERKERLRAEDYQGKTWITRPRPEIDRVGSAWLVRNFIDSQAKFVFAQTSGKQEGALRYDMIDSEFGHHGDCCTFEARIECFGICERAVVRLAEIIHDADLEDDKFHRVEGFGTD